MELTMDFLHVFVDGPVDRLREASHTGAKYPNMIAKEHTVNHNLVMALYDYDRTASSPTTTERFYRYRDTLSIDEALEILDGVKWS